MITLDSIAIKHGTDKSSLHHNYCVVYEKHFESLRDKHIVLLELGTGGYHYEGRGGESMRMWDEYFWRGRIHSVDIYPKTGIKVPARCAIHQCSQTDSERLGMIINDCGQPDIIVDDASHINPLTIESFEILWPRLKPGGIYVVEDTETSYWDAVASDGTDLKGGYHEGTVMNYFKRLTDTVNNKPERRIASIHFYKGLIIIYKL